MTRLLEFWPLEIWIALAILFPAGALLGIGMAWVDRRWPP